MMQSDCWNDFYRTGKVSDYLKYVNSARDTAERTEANKSQDRWSDGMESMNHAGKSDGDGAFGRSCW
nr:hypothetical protein [Eubacterium sp.]